LHKSWNIVVKIRAIRIVGKFQATLQRDIRELYNNTNNNSYSSWELVKHSIPQGSILGPLFFLLFINDLLITPNNAIVPWNFLLK